MSDFTCWVDPGGIPYRLVLKVNPIPGHVTVGFRLLDRELHL